MVDLNETQSGALELLQDALSRAGRLSPEALAPLEAVITRVQWAGSHRLLAEQALIECGYSYRWSNEGTIILG